MPELRGLGQHMQRAAFHPTRNAKLPCLEAFWREHVDGMASRESLQTWWSRPHTERRIATPQTGKTAPSVPTGLRPRGLVHEQG